MQSRNPQRPGLSPEPGTEPFYQQTHCLEHHRLIRYGSDGACLVCEAEELWVLRREGVHRIFADATGLFTGWLEDQVAGCDGAWVDMWLARLRRDPKRLIELWLFDEIPESIRPECISDDYRYEDQPTAGFAGRRAEVHKRELSAKEVA